MSAASDNKPVSELIADALHQFSRLIRSEIHLARAEVSAKAKQAAIGGGLLGAAALFLIPSIILLLLSIASLFMELGMRASLACLLAGLIGLAIVAALAWAGIDRLKAEKLIPRRTLGQFQRDAVAAKEHI